MKNPSYEFEDIQQQIFFAKFYENAFYEGELIQFGEREAAKCETKLQRSVTSNFHETLKSKPG